MRVLDQTGHAIEIRHAAKRYDQVIVLDLKLSRTEPGADGNDPIRQIDVFHFSHHQIGAGTKAPDGGDDIGQADGPGNHFRQHRLIDPVVLAVDQRDCCFFRFEKLLEITGGVHTRETTA